jgi:hypothetical protein
MAANSYPIFSRTLPSQKAITAGGGYTAPQHAFIPHPTTQTFGHGPRIASAQQRTPAISAHATAPIVRTPNVPQGAVFGVHGR